MLKEVLKRFNMLEYSPATLPIEENLNLENNEDEDKVNTTLFK